MRHSCDRYVFPAFRGGPFAVGKVLPTKEKTHATFSISQVNGWAFTRITEGPDLNAYYHEVSFLFVLTQNMFSQKYVLVGEYFLTISFFFVQLDVLKRPTEP